jgi:hypothetical protein
MPQISPASTSSMHYDGNQIPSLLTCTIFLAGHNDLYAQSLILTPIAWTLFQVLQQLSFFHFITLSAQFISLSIFHHHLSFSKIPSEQMNNVLHSTCQYWILLEKYQSLD